MTAANAASTSSTFVSPGGLTLRCLPTAVATSCQSWGSVTRRLRSTGGLADPQPAVLRKMAEELDGCGHNVVVRNRKEGGLGVHRNIPYEFAITLSR